MKTQHSALDAAMGLAGVLFLLMVFEGGVHLLLLETAVGVGVEKHAAGEVHHYQRVARYRGVGELGEYLFAPALMVDQAVRPAFWHWQTTIASP